MKEFLQLLNSHQVEYLLIGGYAVGYLGYPRATGDMDVWVGIDPNNAKNVVSVLREFGFDLPELSIDLFLKENQVIRMGVSPLKIDISMTISGVQFEECYKERIVDLVDGIQISLIDLKHLSEQESQRSSKGFG